MLCFSASLLRSQGEGRVVCRDRLRFTLTTRDATWLTCWRGCTRCVWECLLGIELPKGVNNPPVVARVVSFARFWAGASFTFVVTNTMHCKALNLHHLIPAARLLSSCVCFRPCVVSVSLWCRCLKSSSSKAAAAVTQASWTSSGSSCRPCTRAAAQVRE